MKGSEPKPVKEIILIKHCKNEKGHWVVLTSERALKAMQEYAKAYHKEKIREELLAFRKFYNERYQAHPNLKVADILYVDVNDYLKPKQ